jgi:hypothetical protein
MYSDGLVERRGELITVGMQRLADAATAVALGGWPARPAAELGHPLGDDENAPTMSWSSRSATSAAGRG